LGNADTSKLLLKFAVWLTESDVDADDLMSEARDCVCDPEEGRPWDPGRATFMTHMRIVMRDLARRERRSAQARREVLETTLAIDESTTGKEPGADEALTDARRLDWLRMMGGKLRARLSRLPRALQVFDYACQGVEDSAELARLVGCPVGDVYQANRQIARQAAKVLAEERKSEAARMKELRERAKKKETR
jgi:DNA-directed RNA polymerase specialized sigma24 family protein